MLDVMAWPVAIPSLLTELVIIAVASWGAKALGRAQSLHSWGEYLIDRWEGALGEVEGEAVAMRTSLEKRCARRTGRTTLALLEGDLPAQAAAAAMQVTCKAPA